MRTVTFDPTVNKFKHTLFESVSLQPWSLEYKIMFTEVRSLLNEAINDLWAWYSVTHAHKLPLMEADHAASTQDVLTRFKKLGALDASHIEKLKTISVAPADTAPPGLLNKFLNPLKKGLERLSKVSTYPPLDDAIQATIGRIYTKSESSPFREQIKQVLRALLNFSKKSGWVPSAVLLALGFIQTLVSLPWVGTTLIVLALIMGIVRVVGDLVNGKSLAYALGKAAALYGAGYGAAELLKNVMPVVSAAQAATPPESPVMDALANTDAVRELPPQGSIPEGPIPAPEELQGAAPWDSQPPYTIQRGDTLGKIAQQYGVRVADLMAANLDITNPHRIMPGVELQVPPRSDPGNIWQGFDFRRFPFPQR
jgi:hypothetical protein